MAASKNEIVFDVHRHSNSWKFNGHKHFRLLTPVMNHALSSNYKLWNHHERIQFRGKFSRFNFLHPSYLACYSLNNFLQNLVNLLLRQMRLKASGDIKNDSVMDREIQ